MDIYLIQDAIKELENGDTTLENVADLANLYIVSSRLPIKNTVNQELSDILPAYTNYRKVKTAYQLKETTDTALIKSVRLLCTEIEEFIMTLYRCTDTNRERKCLKDTMKKISTNFEKSA